MGSVLVEQEVVITVSTVEGSEWHRVSTVSTVRGSEWHRVSTVIRVSTVRGSQCSECSE